jgi:transaldolase/glucose-6-phosphate isomerase
LSQESSASLAGRLWERDVTLWPGDDSVRAAIRDRLGWLDSPRWLADDQTELSDWARDIRARGFSQVVLVGMGGSSLAAEVLAEVFGPAGDGLSLTILDNTHPDAITEALGNRAWSRILFVFSSKSGSTIEVQTLCTWVLDNLEEQGVAEPGGQCVAITDPGSPLMHLAVQRHFLDCLEGSPDVGGRFSALTPFAMAPGALLGIDLGAIAHSALQMAEQCKADEVSNNPGLVLGSWLAEQSLAGRDCLQLCIDEQYWAFGSWVEQLIAESTGKEGKGILPLNDADASAPRSRVARVILGASTNKTFWQHYPETDDDGVPTQRITLEKEADLGGEFFRWCFAIAVAGAVMQLNPFDEPDVAATKAVTRELLDGESATSSGALLTPEAFGMSLASSGEGSYLAILTYLPDEPALFDVLEEFGKVVRQHFAIPVTLNPGPRYLHSTGQLHKGGSPHGVFLFVRSVPEHDLDICDEDFGFAHLNHAQAEGDRTVLTDRGRSVCSIELVGPTMSCVAQLRGALAPILSA